MPRKARINNPGLTHHVMARTFNALLLFKDAIDRKFYLACLSRRIHETGFICYAWGLIITSAIKYVYDLFMLHSGKS
jgi:hypothetical protein